MMKLPLVAELRALFEKPLADSEKAPITEWNFKAFLSNFSPDICREDDLDTLFTIRESDSALVHINVAVAFPPPSDGTEASLISFWDDNIRKIVQLLVPSGKSIRHSNCHTETKNVRPDFGFLLNRVCLFRGEEMGHILI